jgi:hypothetical protein
MVQRPSDKKARVIRIAVRKAQKVAESHLYGRVNAPEPGC